MILYILIAAAAVWIGYQIPSASVLSENGKQNSTGGAYRDALTRTAFAALFFVLAVPAVLRQEVGNDYMRYVAFMHLANVHAYVPTEPGFNYLVRLLYGLCGYENYLLVFGVISVLTILFFVEAIRQQAVDFGFSFFLFMAYGCYFQSYNTVRYYLALSAALWSLNFLLRKEYIFFTAAILLAAGFHKSVLVVLILYPLCCFNWKKTWTAAGIILLAVLSVFRSTWMELAIRLYPSYRGTAFLQGGRISWFNIARCAAVVLLSVITLSGAVEPEEEEKERQRVFCQMNLLALVIYVLLYFIPEISRIGYYLVLPQIFLIPGLLRRQEGKKRKLLTALAVLGGIGCFAVFLYMAGKPDIHILPYKTFLFHDLPPAIIE